MKLPANLPKKIFASFSCTLAFLALASAAHAATIIGVSINDVSTELSSREAVNVLNGTGYAAGVQATHTTSTSDMWLSQGTYQGGTDTIGAYPNSFIEFDLGDNYDLSSFTQWNYNENNLSNRGANAVTISVATSLAGTFTSLGSFNFSQAPDDDTTAFGQDIDLSSFTAADNVRAIRFDVTSNHGGNFEFVGLSEVRFDGAVVPEPSSFALLAGCFGLTWVMVRRRA